ncbi:MAG: hypothetical protein J2P48_11425 [Alphaproteobacteria bacterium]|nr:hypothetical protein [Alphaproteobacteria bacterium]
MAQFRMNIVDPTVKEPRLPEAINGGFLVGAIGMASALGLALWVAPAAQKCFAAERSDTAARQPPYSCRLLYDEQRKAAFGGGDKRVIERLKRECLRDGGRP